jgi:hypothetical protein
MQITELGLRPAGPREDVNGGETVLRGGHTVPNVDSVADSHWPQLRIGDGWPVDGRMDHHCLSNSHDGLNVALGNTVVMTGGGPICPTFLISKPITFLPSYTYLYGQKELFELFTAIHLDTESSTLGQRELSMLIF